MTQGLSFEVHYKSGCPYCEYAKMYLAHLAVPVRLIGHDDTAARQAWYDEQDPPLRGPARTMPQIFAVDAAGRRTRIGGYAELLASDVAAQANAAKVMFDVDF